MNWPQLGEFAAIGSAGLGLGLLLALVFWRSAPLRLGFLLLGSTLALATPALYFLRHNVDAGVLPTSVAPPAPVALPSPPTQIDASEVSQTAIAVAQQPIAEVPTDEQPLEIPSWPALMLWTVGSGFMLLRMSGDYLRARRLVSSSRLVDEPYAVMRAKHVAEDLGLALPTVRLSTDIAVPCVLPFGRGVILLPSPLPEASQLDSILLHEAAHIRHMHGWTALLQGLSRAMFWWHPFAWMVDRHADDAMEEVCDGEVRRAGAAQARRLAEVLVQFAESASQRRSRATATMMSSKRGLEHRIRRLVSNGGTGMTHINRTGLVALLTTGCAAAALAVVLQTPTGAPLSKGLMPLLEGAKWDYVMTGNQGKGAFSMTAWTEKPLKGRTLMEMKLGREGYEYWSVRPDGIYLHQNAYLGRLRGVDTQGRETLLLRLPAKLNDSWSWTYQANYQISGNVAPPTREETLVRANAVVEALDEMVKVPAGTFKAIKVVHQEESQMFGAKSTTYWFAEGAGMVKKVETSANGRGAFELRSFRPGTTTRPSQEVAEELLLKTFPGQKPLLKVVENRYTGLLKTRFFTTGHPGQNRMIRVFGNSAAFFDPLVPKDWNTLLAQEAENDQMTIHQIAESAPLLVAIQRGLPVSERTSIPRSESTVDGKGHVTRVIGKAVGNRWELEVTLNFQNNAVVAIKVTPQG